MLFRMASPRVSTPSPMAPVRSPILPVTTSSTNPGTTNNPVTRVNQ